MRIDQKEHLNRIDDEIIAEIRRTRFLVADCTQGETGPRGGVYYEAGFAHGLKIPVVMKFRCAQRTECDPACHDLGAQILLTVELDPFLDGESAHHIAQYSFRRGSLKTRPGLRGCTIVLSVNPVPDGRGRRER